MKVIFLDRDGVINKEVNYLYKIDDFKFIEGIFEACIYFQQLGYNIIIVTNQSGIARGYYSENDYQLLTEWMINQFSNQSITILDVFYCPHGPGYHCECRKPKPGLFTEANDKYNINMEQSWMIGDKEVDITAASAAGISNTILVKTGHKVDETASKAKFLLKSIKDSTQIIA